jgi:hypothetical protein
MRNAQLIINKKIDRRNLALVSRWPIPGYSTGPPSRYI